MADSMGVAGFPHSLETSAWVKVRRNDDKEPSVSQITEAAVRLFDICYGVAAEVLGTYVEFILWDNI